MDGIYNAKITHTKLGKEPSTQMLMTYLSAREFAQFMSDNIGEVLINNVAQEK